MPFPSCVTRARFAACVILGRSLADRLRLEEGGKAVAVPVTQNNLPSVARHAHQCRAARLLLPQESLSTFSQTISYLFSTADFIAKSVGAVMGRLHVMTKYKPAQLSSDLRCTFDRSSAQAACTNIVCIVRNSMRRALWQTCSYVTANTKAEASMVCPVLQTRLSSKVGACLMYPTTNSFPGKVQTPLVKPGKQLPTKTAGGSNYSAAPASL